MPGEYGRRNAAEKREACPVKKDGDEAVTLSCPQQESAGGEGGAFQGSVAGGLCGGWDAECPYQEVAGEGGGKSVQPGLYHYGIRKGLYVPSGKGELNEALYRCHHQPVPGCLHLFVLYFCSQSAG